MTSELVRQGTELCLPELEADGAIFTGWYKDAECTELWSDTVMPGKSIVLYAGWKQSVEE